MSNARCGAEYTQTSPLSYTPLGAWTLKLGEGPGEHGFPYTYEAKFPPMFSLPAMVVGSWWRNDGGRGKWELIEDDFICVLQFATQLNAGPPCVGFLQVKESAIFP
jgi:hypothetical protein